MKVMKKALSVVLTLMLAISVLVPLTVTASAWDVRTNEADLRIGLLSDSHITKSGSSDAKVKTALTALKNLGMDKLAFVGDIVYYSSANDTPQTDRGGYTKLWNAVTESGWKKDDILVYAMGNHEFPQANTDATVSATSIAVFEEEFGRSKNQHVEYEGFHMIAGSPINYNNICGADTESWLKAEIEKAIAEDSTNAVDGAFPEGVVPNSTKPVFVMLHQPMAGTIANQTGSQYSAEFKAYLATRPQVVYITAHKHLLAQHPETICQDAGFTVFQSPMTAGGYQSQWGYTEEGNITESMCSQGSFMEVKDNVVYFYRLDYTNGTYIGEPFVVDIPAIVADRLNSDSADDNAHMPYRTEVRSALSSTAAFPADATVKAEVTPAGKGVSVTFPNTATMTSYDSVQQDNFIRGYKIDVVEGTNVVATDKFQADFWKAPANRAKSYTRTISGLAYDTEYTVNVYPRTPSSGFGAPISTTFKTEKEVVNENTIRYEIEKVCPVAKLNKSSEYASGGGLCISAQGGMISGVTYLSRSDVKDADGNQVNPFTFSFPVELPVGGAYGIEGAMHYRSGNYISEIRVYLDKDTENSILLMDNMKKGDEDLSRGETYPWGKNLPFYHYTANNQELTAGEHTVTVEVYYPLATDIVQPFLFAMDYIEFIPKTPIINLKATNVIEVEDFADGVVVPQTDGTTYKANVWNGDRSSGGKYFAVDSADGKSAIDYLDVVIPIHVEEEAYYNMEYVTCQLPEISIYLDDDSTKLNKSRTRKTDQLKNAAGKYSYFTSGWAHACIDTVSQVLLPKGDHELILRINKRNEGDIAQYIDYVKFIPATDYLSENSALHYEAEDYYSKFIGNTNSIGTEYRASNGQYVYRGSGSAFSFSFPFYAEKTGTYRIELVAATDNMSASTVAIDDGTATKISSFTNKGEIFKKSYYSMVKRVKNFEITEGIHNLVINVPSRSSGGTAYAFDYFHISKVVDEVIVGDNATRIEFEKYASPSGDIKTASYASGGKFVHHNYGNKDTARTIKAEVEVRESGYYDIEYLAGDKSKYSNPDMIADVEFILGDKLLGRNDGSCYESLYSADGYSWTSAKMARYFKDAVWLDAGVYPLEVKVTRAEKHPDKVYNYQVDYIEFRPVDQITLYGNDQFVIAHINSREAMTGTVILAFYEGNELLKIVTTSATDARYKRVRASVSTATKVKAFVIDGYDNVKPLVVHQEFQVPQD